MGYHIARIYGSGLDDQRLGFEYYFLHKAFPDIFDPNRYSMH